MQVKSKQTNWRKQLVLRNKHIYWIPETKAELLQMNIQKIKKLLEIQDVTEIKISEELEH